LREERLVEIEESVRKLFEDIERSIKRGRGVEGGIEWEPPAYRLSKNEQVLSKFLSTFFPQLTPVVSFCVSAQFGRKNVFLIAPRASGKSVTEFYLKLFSRNKWLELDKYKDTKEDLENFARIVSNASVDIGIDDISPMALIESGGESAQKLFSMVSALSFTKRYSDIDVKVENADVSAVAAATHVAAEPIIRSPLWKSQIEDRFLRYWILYKERPIPKIRVGHRDPIPEPPKLEFTPHAVCELSEEDFAYCTELVSFQISEERAVEFARDLLRGHAMLCGRSEVNESDVEWLKLYEPIFRLEPNLYAAAERRRGSVFNPIGYEILYYALKSPTSLRNLAAKVRLRVRDAHRELSSILRGLECGLLIDDTVKITGTWVDQLSHLLKTHEC
jgi:hypothetical protein